MMRLIAIICVLTTVFLLPARAAEDSPKKGGSLVIIGGGLEPDNAAVYQKYLALGGGKENIRIAIMPTASITPVQSGNYCAEDFVRFGVPRDHIKIFPVAVKDDESTKDTNESTWAKNGTDPGLASEILGYNAVFFVGGDQARILATLKDKDGNDSPLLASIRKIYESGGVIGGTSAGAAIMSNPMICGGAPIDALVSGVCYQPGICPDDTKPGVLVSTGLGFFEHGLVDQHFIKRGRCGRMIAALLYGKYFPSGLGFGVDEDTAAVYDSQHKTLEVVGSSGVLVVDTRRAVPNQAGPGSKIQNILLHYLEDGDIYHFDTGQFTINPKRQRIEPGKEENNTAPFDSNIFGKDAVKEMIIGGLVDCKQKEATGIAFTYLPGEAGSAPGGKGVKLVFRKGELTAGYYGDIDDRDTYSAVHVLLDVFPIAVKIME